MVNLAMIWREIVTLINLQFLCILSTVYGPYAIYSLLAAQASGRFILLLFFLVSLFLFEKKCLLLVLYNISPQLQLCGPDLLKVCVQKNNRQKQKHLVIIVDAHPLRESNAGGDLHSSKIMHSVNSEYVDTGAS